MPISDKREEESIVFINPPYKDLIQRKPRCSPVRSGCIFPPIELLSLASLIPDKNYPKIIFIDAVAERLTVKKVIDRIKGYRVQMIVFMPGFESFEYDLISMESIKEGAGGLCKLICFGYLPTQYPKEILGKFKLVDFVILNEPEVTFVFLCNAILAKTDCLDNIKGIAYRRENRILINSERYDPVILDRLPFPDRKMLKNTCYSDPFLNKPMTSIVTSRGCPYQCVFCVDFYGKIFRQRSVENIIRELKHIVCELGIRNIRFVDDNLTMDRNKLISICRYIIDNKLGINWTCLSRIDTLDKEVLAYMSESGCKAVFLGLESGSQRILDYYKKGYSLDLVKKQCRLIKEAGIDIVSWFMLGAPIETSDDIKESLKLSLEIDSDFICLNELRPMPTTDIFDRLKDSISVSLFPFSINYSPIYLSAKQVSRLRRVFYIKFYLSPRVIRKVLMRFMKNPGNILFFLREFISAVGLTYIEK